MPNAVTHPSTQELAAFSLGKLPDDASNAIAGHLEKCPTCRKALESFPADSFLGKVRAAKPGVSSLPMRAGNAPRVENIAASSLPPRDLPPDLVNYAKYHFLRELGRGGMGVVYLAEQTVMGRTVAVKVINPSVLAHPDALPRFQGEVKAAAKLDHPNIVRAHDAEQVGNMHLLVMEYIEGTSLAELVAKKGPQPIAHACHYIRQAALGLQHAFEQGMVHRDIKPQNLMVNPRGQVKVLDFGLARMRSERSQGGGLTQADAFMGTPEYVSPEQATDAHSADTRADIYSLGCTLFFLLTGRPPFQGDSVVKLILSHIEKAPPTLHEVRADVPPELSAVVARMLAKDPAQRFQTPVDVAQELAAFVKAGPKRPAIGVSSPAPDVSSPGTGTAIAADTSKIKVILRDVPGKAPARGAATSAFEGLGDAVATPKKAKPARKAAKPARKKWWIGGSAAVGLLLLGLWASGVFKVKTKDGMIVLENLPPDAEVLIDGGTVTVISSSGKPFEVRVDASKKSHRVEVKRDGFKVFGEEVEVDAGRRKSIVVRLEPIVRQDLPPQANTNDKEPAGRVEEKWIREVAALPSESQIKAVAANLKELNPGFDGKIEYKVEGGQVVSLDFSTVSVKDISPVRALPELRRLVCNGTYWARNGQLADLTPLKGMKLTSLECHDTQVADLSPLRGMPLTALYCFDTKVSDLSPLKDMKLTSLHCSNTKVADLSPLKDMKLMDLACPGTPVSDLSPLKDMRLTDLDCSSTRVWNLSPLKDMRLTSLACWGTPVSDLSPLKDMKLTRLNCGSTRVSDLSLLKDMKLTYLHCGSTRVSDLSLLKDMKLTYLHCENTRVSDLSPLKDMKLTDLDCSRTPVSDLSPLKGMLLKEVICDFRPGRDAEILRSIKTLEKINDKPAAQFWKEVDGKP